LKVIGKAVATAAMTKRSLFRGRLRVWHGFGMI